MLWCTGAAHYAGVAIIQALHHIVWGTRSVSWMRAEAEQALVQWQATVEGGTAQQTAGVPVSHGFHDTRFILRIIFSGYIPSDHLLCLVRAALW